MVKTNPLIAIELISQRKEVENEYLLNLYFISLIDFLSFVKQNYD